MRISPTSTYVTREMDAFSQNVDAFHEDPIKALDKLWKAFLRDPTEFLDHAYSEDFKELAAKFNEATKKSPEGFNSKVFNESHPHAIAWMTLGNPDWADKVPVNQREEVEVARAKLLSLIESSLPEVQKAVQNKSELPDFLLELISIAGPKLQEYFQDCLPFQASLCTKLIDISRLNPEEGREIMNGLITFQVYSPFLSTNQKV